MKSHTSFDILFTIAVCHPFSVWVWRIYFLDNVMSVNEIGEEVLFADDEGDALFITAVEHDPGAAEIINNFSHMLGEAGEEFLATSAQLEAEPVDLDSLIPVETDTFDLDHLIATAPSEETAPPSSIPLGEALPEIAENSIDLDQLFDAMKISAVPSYSDTADFEFPVASTGTDAIEEMALLSSSNLSVSMLDNLDSGAGLDDIFKKLVLADES